RLYLRIWLAVVGGVAVLTLLVGWAWQSAEEHNARNTVQDPLVRELSITSADGQVLLQGPFERKRRRQGDGLQFIVQAEDGQQYQLEMTNHRGRPPPPAPSPWDIGFWLRPPFGFIWLLGLVGLAVALGVFPIIRRLLKRLEQLQRSVQRFGEGDLSIRVPEQGQDEVADLARQFNAAAQRIQTLVQSHQSLLANASHELRSPLARIRMGLELMGDAPEQRSAKAEIQRNIAELDQLVDEILLASRLEQPHLDPSAGSGHSMGTIETVDMIGLAAEECARVDADLDLPADTLGSIEIPGVAKLLRRAVRNLLENARRYSQDESASTNDDDDAPSSISLSLHPQGEQLLLRVQDRGPGVPAAYREQIFDKFYRLPGASERSGGVGLGLALVRSIAQHHGGSVRCTDRPDGQSGACFELCLPAVASLTAPSHKN
ncbi:MAG: HAMP domain-containing protein, partial [Comamonas sp.]|nr:HAMP domain-containing protein [Comamonas sp.]